MDELVELLKFLLVIDFLGNRRDGPQAVHDVVLNKHGSIAAHGEGDGIARTRIDPMLAAVGQNNDRRIEHGRLGTDNLNTLEFCIQSIKRIEQQVMGNRAGDTTAVDTTANSRSLKGTSLDREGAQRRGGVRFAAALAKYDKRWHGTGGHDDGLYVDTNHGTPPVRSG